MEKKTNTTKKQTKTCAKKGKNTEKVMFTKDTTLGEVIATNEKAQAVLMGFGMHCFGCSMTQMETLEEASMVHGIELDLLLKKLNELK